MSEWMGPVNGHDYFLLQRERDTLHAENQKLRKALEWIANWTDEYMAQARTLHYDMRGRAREALSGEEAQP